MTVPSVLFGQLLFATIAYSLSAKGKVAGAHHCYNLCHQSADLRRHTSRLPPDIRSSLLRIHPALQCDTDQSRWSSQSVTAVGSCFGEIYSLLHDQSSHVQC